MSSANAPRAAGMSPLAKLAYARSMISLFVAMSSPFSLGRLLSPKDKAFARGVQRFVRNEHFLRSRRPSDVDTRFVATRDPGHDRLVQVRRELRRPGREVGDGVADRPRHVEARLLGRRPGTPRPAAQTRRSFE